MTDQRYIRKSCLARIICDSITAFPEDSHQKVYSFLLEEGIGEKEATIFRQSWSKSILGIQSFGRSKQENIDVNLFEKDFIRELSCNDEVVNSVLNALITIANKMDKVAELNSGHLTGNCINSRDTLESLSSMNAIEQVFSEAVAAQKIIAESMVVHDFPLLGDSSLYQLRNSLKNTVVSWMLHQQTVLCGASFSPLDTRLHGKPIFISGNIENKAQSALSSYYHSIPLNLGSQAVVGMRISSMQPVFTERAWNAFMCLNELAAINAVENCFPVPINCTMENNAGSSATVLVFESVQCKALHDLRGPVLATFLRKYPSIVMAWCLQLFALIKSLKRCSGKLLQAINPIKDVFVRENGLLLFGNVAFSGNCDRGEDFSDAPSLLTISHNILSEALGVSRRVDIELGMPSNRMFSEDQSRSSSKAHQSRENALSEVTDTTVAFHVVVGSSLCVAIKGMREVSRVDIVENEKLAKTVAEKNCIPADTLTVHVSDQRVQVAHVRCSMTPARISKNTGGATTSSALVNLKALQPGVVTLTFALPAKNVINNHPTSTGIERVKVNVVIVPAYPVQSVYIQELLGALEESYFTNNYNVLMTTACFSSSSKISGQDFTSSNRPSSEDFNKNVPGHDSQKILTIDSRKTSHDWTEVLRLLSSTIDMQSY